MRLFRFLFRRNSKELAKDRLKLLLISDRTDCSADMLEMIKNDIIQVISKYMEIDTEGLDIQITRTESENHNGSVPALYANIPIICVKHQPEYQGLSLLHDQ